MAPLLIAAERLAGRACPSLLLYCGLLLASTHCVHAAATTQDMARGGNGCWSACCAPNQDDIAAFTCATSTGTICFTGM